MIRRDWALPNLQRLVIIYHVLGLPLIRLLLFPPGMHLRLPGFSSSTGASSNMINISWMGQGFEENRIWDMPCKFQVQIFTFLASSALPLKDSSGIAGRSAGACHAWGKSKFSHWTLTELWLWEIESTLTHGPGPAATSYKCSCSS